MAVGSYCPFTRPNTQQSNVKKWDESRHYHHHRQTKYHFQQQKKRVDIHKILIFLLWFSIPLNWWKHTIGQTHRSKLNSSVPFRIHTHAQTSSSLSSFPLPFIMYFPGAAQTFALLMLYSTQSFIEFAQTFAFDGQLFLPSIPIRLSLSLRRSLSQLVCLKCPTVTKRITNSIPEKKNKRFGTVCAFDCLF